MNVAVQVIRLLRPEQWTKNFFVIAPAFFGGVMNQPSQAWRAITAFLLFCAASSAVYVFNDIMDRARDRQHPHKRRRPLASGGVGLGTAWILAVGLFALSLAGSHSLNFAFICILTAYLAQGWAYSLYLKRIPIVDVLSLSAGFLLRVLGGGAAVDIVISPWLLVCTLALSLFLGFGKRRAELDSLAGEGNEQRPVLDGYSLPFLDQCISLVTTTTLISYILYVASPETAALFGTRAVMLTIAWVLYGIFRYLSLVYTHKRGSDPAGLLLRDPPLMAACLGWGLSWVAVIYIF